MDIDRYLAESKESVDRELDRLLAPETEEPATIHRAMRYSVFAGGKRVRPILVLAAGESVGGARETLLHLGCAVEMLHTYSLIHDDLPALDNDDLRRGVPTCHKVFGEAMAILAGDALLTRCYQLLGELPSVPGGDATRLALVRELARATGTTNGMIGGQVVDLESEGKPIGAATLEYIHRSKTGALLSACTRTGGLASGASARQMEALDHYGRNVGLMFQIVDDILDVTGNSADLGKTAGKDQKVKKATYPALYGLEASRAKARALSLAAIRAVEPLGEAAATLCSLAQFIHTRTT